MLSLARAGYVAAGRQFAAVLLIALAVVTLIEIRMVWAGHPMEAFHTESQLSLFFAYADILAAIAVISTCNQSILQTADALRHASRLMYPTDPSHAADVLQSLLWITAAGFAIMIVKPPPSALAGICDEIGLCWGVRVGWPGVMSICMAAFGANARAVMSASRGQG